MWSNFLDPTHKWPNQTQFKIKMKLWIRLNASILLNFVMYLLSKFVDFNLDIYTIKMTSVCYNVGRSDGHNYF